MVYNFLEIENTTLSPFLSYKQAKDFTVYDFFADRACFVSNEWMNGI